MMRRTVVSAIATLLAAASLTLSAYAQQSSTAFTYQGFLKDDGQPANGTYDLKFTLYDAATEGNAIGNPVFIEDLQIQNGLFTVEIDFGVSPFAQGQRRWIEIGIRPGNSTDEYSLLTPRIELTPVPYALYAQKAKDAENAQNAQNAENAQNAQNAENAQNAVNAQNAQTAQVANSVAPDSVTSAGLANDPNSLSKVSGGNLSITPEGFLKKDKQVYVFAKVPRDVSGGGRIDDRVWALTPTNTGAYKREFIRYVQVVHNIGNGYDASTGIFTAPVSGFYAIGADAQIGHTTQPYGTCQHPTFGIVRISGNEQSTLAYSFLDRSASGYGLRTSVPVNTVAYLRAGDQIRICVEVQTNHRVYGFYDAGHFYVYLLSAADEPSN